jgi:decaprenylphospho-beta-D-erythro-pentofuranosid-2-ulose 2-reductase
VKAVILGATKGIGRAIARQLAQRGESLFLLGRDASDLERSARDLEVRGARQPIGTARCDLEDPHGFAGALDAARLAMGDVDTVIVTAALFATQDQLEADSELLRRVLTVNFANTIVFCEQARKLLLSRGGGCLCVVSSVAGERGRKPVIGYGASKAGLSAYLEGLDHKFHAQGLQVVCVKPGFVKTGMTTGLQPPPFAGEPSQVARDIVAAIDRGQPVLYTPRMWGPVMYVIRKLPRFVMRRINF